MPQGEPGELWSMIWAQLLGASPFLLVLLAGLVLAVVNLGRHRAPALLVGGCLAVWIAVSLIEIVGHQLIMHRVYTGERFYEEVRTPLQWLSISTMVVRIICLGGVLASVFAWRGSGPGRPADTAVAHMAPPSAPGTAVMPGPGPTNPISKPVFLAAIIGLPILALVFIIPAYLMLLAQEDELVPISIGLNCFGLILAVVAAVFGAVLVYKLWASIQDGEPRTTPGKAVGFLFIPLFNLYWVFQAYRGFAVDFNAYAEQRGLGDRRVSVGVATTLCVLIVAGIIPFVSVLLAPVNLVLAVIFLSSAISGANEARAARRGATG